MANMLDLIRSNKFRLVCVILAVAWLIVAMIAAEKDIAYWRVTDKWNTLCWVSVIVAIVIGVAFALSVVCDPAAIKWIESVGLRVAKFRWTRSPIFRIFSLLLIVGGCVCTVVAGGDGVKIGLILVIVGIGGLLAKPIVFGFFDRGPKSS